MKYKDRKAKEFFIWLGNKTNKLNILINRQILKLDNKHYKVIDLTENGAIEKGVEAFYEGIIYFCILGLPIIETCRSYVQNI